MPRKIKERRLMSRVDEQFGKEVDAYVNDADLYGVSELIRLALEEYMRNHPITIKKEDK